MIVIVAYDITDDHRRSRVAARLQAVGDRIQKSVFLLEVTGEGLEELRQKLVNVLDLDEDSLYLFRQCAACWTAIDCVGQARPPTQDLYWAVF